MMKAQCHCRECQYITGGGPNMFVAMPVDGFKYTASQPKQFTRSDLERAVTREFCAECGTHMVTKVPGLPAVVLKVGTFDDPCPLQSADGDLHGRQAGLPPCARRHAGLSSGCRSDRWALCACLRRDERHSRKVGSIAPRITRQKRKLFDRRMSANEKIRQHAAAGATCVAVLNGSLAREEQRHPRYRYNGDASIRQSFFEILDLWKADRRFCKDDVIDQEWTLESGVFQLRKRPLPPARSLRENVQQDVRIHQRHGLIPARDGHDFVRGRTRAGDTEQLGKAAGLPRPIGFFDHDAAVGARRNSTWLPGVIPRCSRTGFGIVTWPLLVTVVAMANSQAVVIPTHTIW